MKKGYFIYKTYCELAIISDVVIPDLITDELNIVPDRSFKKGEQSVSIHSGSIITKPHNLWAIKSKTSENKNETINHHIEQLRSILIPKINIIKKYKEDLRFEVCFGIWIETNNSGIGLDLCENEMNFFNSISNRIHFSLLTK